MPLLIAIVICFIVTKFIFFIAVIPSESMVPTLNEKDRLIVLRTINKDNIKPGDIIVFEKEGEENYLVKRVIGVGGDEIYISKGVLYRNGELIDEPYIKELGRYSGMYTVPEGELFFLGDNRNNSTDSSKWQDPYIPKENVVGKVVLKIYPFKDFGTID